ncbi:MAG: hypothetical protein P8J85_01075, partial [Alphaproteobacteria bacterium]|nr:hypothetical protein [Alphaproteobacteria bacterium]
MSATRYDYKPKLLKQILILVLMIPFIYGCYLVAEKNDRGLILNRVFEFSQSEATNLLWGITLLFAAAAV